MAKRRMLKKKINDIIDIAAGLCLIEAARASGEKRKEYGKLFMDIDDIRDEIIKRISHTEPGSVKLFYKKLQDDFDKGMIGFFAKLEELGKDE